MAPPLTATTPMDTATADSTTTPKIPDLDAIYKVIKPDFVKAWLERLDNVCALAKIDPTRLDLFLYHAVASGPVAAVEAAIRKGAQLCLLKDVGETALHLAMRIKSIAKLKLLLNNFAYFNARDYKGENVGDKIADCKGNYYFYSNQDCAELFLQRNEDKSQHPVAQNNDGFRPN